MPDLDKTTAAAWLQSSERPVLFYRVYDPATATGVTTADWRFVKVKNAPRTIADLKALLVRDFTDAPLQVRNVAKAAWLESDESKVVAKVCDVLDALRDNWASFNAASKTWLLAWAAKRGIKRKNEED